jgi:hypothetical protein
MSDSGRLDRPLVDKPLKLLGTFAGPYSNDPANTNSVHRRYLDFDVSMGLARSYGAFIPELTDCSKYSMAWSWLV